MDEFFKPYELPDRPHLVRPGGGLSNEIFDLREDISAAFARVNAAKGSTTSESMQIWANGTTGDDANDGLTEATPKKTLEGALSVLPDILKHHCTINVRGEFVLSGWYIIRRILYGAILVVDGGPEVEVLAGPFTSTGATALSIADSGQSWTVDEHAGAWVEILDGPAAGETRTIYENDATTLYPQPSGDWSVSPGVGATFRIVQPATRFTAPSGWNPIIPSCIPQNTFQNYLAIQRVMLVGGVRIYHVGGNAVYSAMVSRPVAGGTSYFINTPGMVLFNPAFTDPVTYGFDSVTYLGVSHIGSGVGFRREDGRSSIHRIVSNGGEVQFLRNVASGGGNRVIGHHMSVKDSILEGSYRVSGAAGVGMSFQNSDLDMTELQADNCGSHGIEVNGGKLVCQGAVIGSGNAGAGAYVHSHAVVQTKAGTPPTITGTVGEVSLDGTTQQSTWAAVEGGTPINGATAGNDEFVIVKKV
jgi:hypothetical protein